jgi:polyribonucleotide nucleotidyltransferase
MSDGVTRVSVEIAGSEISFETGRMAKQASGAVVVRQGDTMVLATAVAGSLRDVDFLPLTVDVEERMYAAGKIPGSFFKREGRPGEKGTLTARTGALTRSWSRFPCRSTTSTPMTSSR